MGSIWAFLRNDKNRTVLAWIGGGAAVAAGGAWVVIAFLLTNGVEADRGSVAIGGDMRNGTITIHAPPPSNEGAAGPAPSGAR